MFARQLLTMFDSGVAIHQALDFYAAGNPSDLGTISGELVGKISSGSSLSFALSGYPRVFSPVFIGLIQAGERTGDLSVMLAKLAELLEAENRLLTKLRAAITYPIFLMSVSVVVACIFMYGILPALQPMLVGMGVEPPLPTRMLMTLAVVIRHPLVIYGVPLLAGLLWWKGDTMLSQARAHPRVSRILDLLPLRVPVVGDLYQRILLSRVLYAMAMSIEAGLSINQALHLGRSITDNSYFQDALERTAESLREGKTISESLSLAEVFPAGMVQMIAVGEETSSLGTVMGNVAKMYGEDASYKLETSVQLLEPIMMGGMGVVSGFLVIAAILPLVKMIDSM